MSNSHMASRSSSTRRRPTVISDDKRREVAARMRGILRDDPHGWLDAMVVNAVTDVLGEGVTIGETVADLIDRPTCHDVADFDRESFKCSRCGFRVLSIDGAPDAAKLVGTKGGVIDFGYCPNCGAEVV